MFSKVLRPRVVGFPAELPHTASSQYGVSTPPAPRCGMRADVAALPGGPRARLSRVAVAAPPETFFVVSAIFHYLGPAFAVLLFVRVEPVGVAWLRIVFAAVVFAAWRRPWRAFQRLDRRGRANVMAMGVVLGLMNPCFYIAIDRLPLGTVAAIDFLPVLALPAPGPPTPRTPLPLAAAVVGVY